MNLDLLEKFLSDSRAYLSQIQPRAASLLIPFCELARPGRLLLPLPEQEPSTSFSRSCLPANDAGPARRLQKSASAVFLAVTLATVTGCAATPTSESTGQYVDDAVITAKVKAAILDRPTLKLLEIKVDTFKGVVTLSGVVRSQSTINEAVEVASAIAGVKSVKNNMRLM